MDLENIGLALTFDDVLLLPQHSTVLPNEVKLNTRLTKNIALNLPMLSAAMDTVTNDKLAIAIAQEGGIGIVHKNMSITEQAKIVCRVKKFEAGMVMNPITVTPNTTIQTLLELTKLNNISGVPVVEGTQVVGIVTHRDWRFETALEKSVCDIMTPKEKLITVLEGASEEKVRAILQQHRLEKLLVVNEQFELKGIITVKDFEKAKDKPLACKDQHGRLRVGAAVGTGQDTIQRVNALFQAGVDVIIVDTAHGHSSRVLETVKLIKKQFPQLDVIGGNIATKDAALALKQAGADAVKVGIGPGSICTTRVVTGVGVPQISAIVEVAQALKGSGIPIVADGGVRYSGDLAKAIAAGADSVMLGSLFAGTAEAPGEVELFQGRSYKTYRGMGSLAAMSERFGSSDRYFQDASQGLEKLVPEGIEARVPYKGSMVGVIHQMIGGLRSAMGYVGAKDIPTFHQNAKFVRITSAGVQENHVHDVVITKEAPNYRTTQ